MRIAHYLHHYPTFSGTTVAVQGLATGLAGSGHQVTIYCGGEPGIADSGGLRIRRFSGETGPPFHIPSDLRAVLHGNLDELDLLVVHGIFNLRAVAAARAAERGGIPYVVCPHGLHSAHLLRRHRLRKLIFGRMWERPMLERAAAIHAFSHYQERTLREYGVRAPIFVAPNGLNPDEVPRELIAPRPVSGDAPGRLLFLGRIDPFVKGLDLFLAALARAIGRGAVPRDVTLDLVGPGDGAARQLTAEAHRLGLSANVHFPGPVSPRLRWNTIADCDLLVLPSRHDAFPSTVLEGMLLGKPVLVSTESGVAELVEQAGGGFLAAPSVESIEAGLARSFAARADWAEIGARGRVFARQHLRWDCIARAVACCYQQAVSGAPVTETVLL